VQQKEKGARERARHVRYPRVMLMLAIEIDERRRRAEIGAAQRWLMFLLRSDSRACRGRSRRLRARGGSWRQGGALAAALGGGGGLGMRDHGGARRFSSVRFYGGGVLCG
jgi:hypothetical protein